MERSMSAITGDTPTTALGPDDFGSGLPPGVGLIRILPDRRVDAAIRLVGDQTDDPYSAGRRFLESADELGIDLSLMWATQDASGAIRQVSLAVPGTGRTAMMFVSGAAKRRRGSISSIAELGSGPGPTRERVAVLRAACRHVAKAEPGRRACSLAQTLLEPRETDALVAYRAAGFTQLGDLAYMRRAGHAPGAAERALPETVTLVSVARRRVEGASDSDIDRDLKHALAESYIETMDCPELCGLRSVDDVLESHRAVGRYDPALWWLVLDEGRPAGCMLLNVCPEHESVELVYLGLAKPLRGRGLGSTLLNLGLRQVLGADPPAAAGGVEGAPARRVVGAGGVTCAVDTRNLSAIKLYRSAGFQRFAVRVPLVFGLVG